jgi:acyl-CoA dehydrogenase
MQVEAANLMVWKAATLFDKGEECGVEANAAKYLAAEAGYEACQTAMMTRWAAWAMRRNTMSSATCARC